MFKAQAKWNIESGKRCEKDPDYLEFGGGTHYPGSYSRVIYILCILKEVEKRTEQLRRQAR